MDKIVKKNFNVYEKNVYISQKISLKADGLKQCQVEIIENTRKVIQVVKVKLYRSGPCEKRFAPIKPKGLLEPLC